eukprot:1430687-Amphidinium_carterae.1
MPEIIRVLRDRGVGAHSASDPRGLDSIVAEVMSSLRTGAQSVEPAVPSSRKRKKANQKVLAPTAHAVQQEEPVPLEEASRLNKRRKVVLLEEVGQEVGLWWKPLLFDGYTGEQWEAWCT